MIDETIKIPEPIIDPATSMVESSKPNPRTNFCSVAAGVAVMLSFKRMYSLAAHTPSRNLAQIDSRFQTAHAILRRDDFLLQSLAEVDSAQPPHHRVVRGAVAGSGSTSFTSIG